MIFNQYHLKKFNTTNWCSVSATANFKKCCCENQILPVANEICQAADRKCYIVGDSFSVSIVKTAANECSLKMEPIVSGAAMDINVSIKIAQLFIRHAAYATNQTNLQTFMADTIF